MSTTILIVDDSAMIRLQVARALRGGGYDVTEAFDGLDAWEQLGGGGAQPAMIVCDINMPRMNGLELLERINQSAVHRTIPIVMLTTEGQPGTIRRARELGACGWIIKPFQPELLLATVSKLAKSRAAPCESS